MSTRVLRAVIDNFLGTYVSRNSDYEGYWLFGFLVPTLEEMRVNLVAPPSDDRPAFQYAIDLAVRRFSEQVQKHHVQPGRVRKAELRLLARKPTNLEVDVKGFSASGWIVQASVAVESNRGRGFHAERFVWVAPHNAIAERRRARA